MRVKLKGIMVKKFSQWCVTTYGVECLALNKPIHKKRLSDLDFIAEMMRANWVHEDDFKQAVVYASTYHQIYFADSQL